MKKMLYCILGCVSVGIGRCRHSASCIAYSSIFNARGFLLCQVLQKTGKLV